MSSTPSTLVLGRHQEGLCTELVLECGMQQGRDGTQHGKSRVLEDITKEGTFGLGKQFIELREGRCVSGRKSDW